MLKKILQWFNILINGDRYDFVTNLPNKNKFYNVLGKTMKKLKKEDRLGAVYLIDIDNFKRINDILGHREGDKILKKTAQEIESILTAKERLFRFGEDEFLIIQEYVKDLDEVKSFSEYLLNSINKNFVIKDKYIYLSISIGITLISSKDDSADIVLRKVDSALYKAKDLGKGRYEIYNKKITEDIIRRCKIEKKLRNAITEEKIEIYYQPQISLKDGKVTGIEALLRWSDEELGYISPPEFIPIAEDTGLINDLGKWILKRVCEQNKRWKDKGYEYEYISINVSPVQFESVDFIESIVNTLESTKLTPSFLQLEITENLLMKSMINKIAMLKKLREIGVSIALDDFGTGYSSLSYLRALPINVLKIDKSFIYSISTSDIEEFVVETIIRLAHKLNMVVVVEGVEEKNQIDFLKDIDCDKVQGYYYSKAIPPHELEDILNHIFVD